jgi:uncharacterized protein
MLELLGLGPTGSVLLAIAFLVTFSIVAGFLGSLLGLGGGLFIVPMLILVFQLTPTLAVATSLVAVIATSSGAASIYVGQGVANTRLGMFLEVATVLGGVVGAGITVYLLDNPTGERILVLAFIPVVLTAAVLMYRGRNARRESPPPPDPLARRLRLGGWFDDTADHRWAPYEVGRTGVGLTFSACAGVVSGLLGIGGGMFYVPAMNTFMGVPIRIAGATSNFMIGVTATAGALVYLFAGDIALFWTAPVVVGMLVGSRLGTVSHRAFSTQGLKLLFVAVLVLGAVLMALRGAGLLA